MAQPQQEPVDNWMFLADPDSFHHDFFEQSNQQNLFDLNIDSDTPTYGNIAFDDQKAQQTDDGLTSVSFDIGGSNPLSPLSNGDLEPESWFGSSDHNMLPVLDIGLQDGGATMNHRLPRELVAGYSDPMLAELNCDNSEFWECRNHAPAATASRGFEPHYTEVTSLNPFVDPNSIASHLATERGTVSGNSSQATTVTVPQGHPPPLDGDPAWFTAALSDQGEHCHHTGSITKNNTASTSYSYPGQSQCPPQATPTSQKCPVRRKHAKSKAQVPGCLTLDLGLQGATTKTPRKRKTKEQLEMTNIVKSRGACLRCRFEKQKVGGQQTFT